MLNCAKCLVYFQDGKYTKALTLFQEIYDERADGMLTEHLGDAYFKTGDKTNALKYWKKAMEIGSKNKVLKQKIDKIDYYEPEY